MFKTLRKGRKCLLPWSSYQKRAHLAPIWSAGILQAVVSGGRGSWPALARYRCCTHHFLSGVCVWRDGILVTYIGV